MKIAPSIDPAVADAAVRGATRPATTASPAGVQATPAVAATDAVDVSSAGAQLGALAGRGGAGDFDAAKVDAIRQAIRDGRFKVNPHAIADRLISDAAALAGPKATQ